MDLNSASGDNVLPILGYGTYQRTVAKTFPASAVPFGRTASAIQSPKARLSVLDSSPVWYMKGSQPLSPSPNCRFLNSFPYWGQKQSDLKSVGLELGSQLHDDDFAKLLSATGKDKPSLCMTEATAEDFGKTQHQLWMSTPVRTVEHIEHKARKYNGLAASASNGSGCSSRYLPDENDMPLYRGSEWFSEDLIDAQCLTSRIDEEKNFDAQSAETTGSYQAEDCNTGHVEWLQQADDWNSSPQNFWSMASASSTDVDRMSDSTTRSLSVGSGLQSLSGKAELTLKSDWQNKFDFSSNSACVPQEGGWEPPFETLDVLEKLKRAMNWKSNIIKLRNRDKSSGELTPLIKILKAIRDPANYLWLIKETGFMSVSFVHLPNEIHLSVLDRLGSIAQHYPDYANQVLSILFDPFEKKDESYVAKYLDQCIYDHVDNIMTDRNDEAIQLGKNIIMILTHVVELGLCSRTLDKMLKILVISYRTWSYKKTSFFVQLLSPEKRINEIFDDHHRRHKPFLPKPSGAVSLYRTIYLQHIRELMEFAESNLIEKIRRHGTNEEMIRVQELFYKPWNKLQRLQESLNGKINYCPMSSVSSKRAESLNPTYSDPGVDEDIDLIIF